MIERKIEDMCVVCNDHDKPSCGYEERGLQRKCPYNDFIERGYELAEKDLALTWKDAWELFEIVTSLEDEAVVNNDLRFANDEYLFTEALKRFNEWRKKK